MIITGLENITKNPRNYLKNKKIGLLSNSASVDSMFNHASRIINKIFPNQLKALFSPQHGFYVEKQDNMVESKDIIEPVLGIPIFSLYSNIRIPEKKMFDLIDVLIIDLQDVGTRVYTFIYTISYCLEAAAQYNKKVVILDRPNPLGGVEVEGNILLNDYKSFVGRFPIPMRHGLTVGEISFMFNNYFSIGCDLEIIPMKGWKRKMFFFDTFLPWIPPSPNLCSPVSAMVYPGQVIFEGTNISEGRGTTQPFELFGAPFIKQNKIFNYGTTKISGAVLRPVYFEPTSNKWQNQICKGFQIHVTDFKKFKPYKTSLMLLQKIIKHHKYDFQWKQPPYEYEYKKLPIDLILGDKNLRKQITDMKDINKIENSWQKELSEFKKISRKFYLYN